MEVVIFGILFLSCWIVFLVILFYVVGLVMYFVVFLRIDGVINVRDLVKVFWIVVEYGLVEDIFGMFFVYC